MNSKMKERYESILLTDLRQMAKNRGVKNVTDYKKDALVTLMLELDEEDAKKAATTTEGVKQEAVPKEAAKKDAIKKEANKKVATNKGTANREVTKKETASKEVAKKENNKDITPNKTNANGATSGDSNQSTAKRQNDGQEEKSANETESKLDSLKELDSGVVANGILEVMPEGFGFIRCENFLPGDHDVYVANGQIKRFGLRTGDVIEGHIKVKTSEKEKFAALLYLTKINGLEPEVGKNRCQFENMTPIFPNEKLKLETPGAPVSMRIMDLLCPVGKGQRGMIVSPPKAGKTTLLKSVAKSIKASNPDMHMIILLIDERPEEVTDIKEEVRGANVEVIYSTFDETPEHHKRVSEMVIERARRLVEYKKDVIILLDSITRLTRAYNQVVPPSGRTLSGGLDPAALHMPKRFFGAARNMREGGSLTILATALVETGSKMDDVVYEEFKGTGNMEMVLDRKLSERRVFPAIDIPKSGTRRDDLLLSVEELEAVNKLRRSYNDATRTDDSVNWILDSFAKTRNNREFVNLVGKMRIL